MDQLDVCTDTNVMMFVLIQMSATQRVLLSTLRMQGFSVVETGFLHSFKIELKMLVGLSI